STRFVPSAATLSNMSKEQMNPEEWTCNVSSVMSPAGETAGGRTGAPAPAGVAEPSGVVGPDGVVVPDGVGVPDGVVVPVVPPDGRPCAIWDDAPHPTVKRRHAANTSLPTTPARRRMLLWRSGVLCLRPVIRAQSLLGAGRQPWCTACWRRSTL